MPNTRSSISQDAHINLLSGLFSCSDRPPDARWQEAVRLAQNKHGNRPLSDDLWVREATRYLKHKGDRNLPMPQQQIGLAHKLWKSQAFDRCILEARLLAQESTKDIAERSGLDRITVKAYAALFCDVADRRGTGRRLWGSPPPCKQRQPKSWLFGKVLERMALLHGELALERAIDITLRLQGPTLADGLPASHSPGFLSELLGRFLLVGPFLPHSLPVQNLFDRINVAVAQGAAASELPNEDLVEMMLEAVRQAKLPAGMLQEIEEIRQRAESVSISRSANSRVG